MPPLDFLFLLSLEALALNARFLTPEGDELGQWSGQLLHKGKRGRRTNYDDVKITQDRS